MINFRYHLVSLVAVFLALAIGIVAGSTVIKESILDSTQKNLDQAEKNLKDLENTNAKLSGQLNALNGRDKALAQSGAAGLLADRLVGTPVLFVEVDGVDDDTASTLRKAITDAGATSAGLLTLTSRIALTDPNDINRLRNALAVQTLDPDVLRSELADRFANLAMAVATRAGLVPDYAYGGEATSTTITTGDTGVGVASSAVATTVPSTTTTAPPSASLVASRALRAFLMAVDATGLANLSLPSQADNQDLAGLRIVVISGAGAKVDNAVFVYPFLQTLAGATQPVTVAVESTKDGSGVARGSFVGPIRNDGRLRQRVSTVDDAEWFVGWAASVMAIEDLGAGRVGQYGIGDGAGSLLPSSGS